MRTEQGLIQHQQTPLSCGLATYPLPELWWLTTATADRNEDDRLLLNLAFQEVAPHLNVVYLNDGTQAIHYLSGCADVPLLLLTDLNMPGVSGLELIEHIQQCGLFGVMPTVVLTTSTDKADRRRCYKAGANAYLVKPMSQSECAELVRSLVRVWLVDHG